MHSYDQKIAQLKADLAWDSSGFYDATQRLQDWLTNWNDFDRPLHHRFRTEWKSALHAEFIPLLEAAVLADSLSKRGEAVVTLGRIGAKQSVGYLQGIFERALIDDPLLLRHLLGEISWLTETARRAELAQQIADAQNWTSRWVVFLIDPVIGDELTETRLPEIQQQMVADPHPIIAANAKSGDANLFFSKVDQVFRNQIWDRGGRYTVKELADFIESFQLDDYLTVDQRNSRQETDS